MLASVAVLASTAAEARVTNKYGRWGFGKPYGYKERIVAPNRWEVSGLGSSSQPGYMRALVMRRTAVLARAAGYDHFYVVGAGFACAASPFANSPGGQGPHVCDYVLSQSGLAISVGTASADEKPRCEGRALEECQSFDVAEVIRITNGFFGLTDADAQAEVEKIKSSAKRG